MVDTVPDGTIDLCQSTAAPAARSLAAQVSNPDRVIKDEPPATVIPKRVIGLSHVESTRAEMAAQLQSALQNVCGDRGPVRGLASTRARASRYGVTGTPEI